jgi:prepilin-type N-terminal cleavage/methylation domain-containing protein
VKKHAGFTLIEVMVAAAIIGIAATALFSLLSRSLSNITTIENVHHFHLAGEEIMNRVLLLPSFPRGGTIQGDLTELGARWAVTFTPWIPQKVEDTTTEAVMKIDVEIQWQGRTGDQRISLEALKSAELSRDNSAVFQKAIENALPN